MRRFNYTTVTAPESNARASSYVETVGAESAEAVNHRPVVVGPSTVDSTLIGDVRISGPRQRYVDFLRTDYATHAHESAYRDTLRVATNRAYFPNPQTTEQGVRPLPFAPVSPPEAGRRVIAVSTDETVPDVVFAVHTKGTRRREDCAQAYWLSANQLCVAVHIVDATRFYPVGSVQDRAFSANNGTVNFTTPSIPSMHAPCGPFRGDTTDDSSIPMHAVLSKDDSFRITKDCDEMRKELYFTTDGHRESVSAFVCYDVVLVDGCSVLRRNYAASRFERTSVRLGACYDVGGEAFVAACAALKRRVQTVSDAANAAHMHSLVMSSAAQCVDAHQRTLASDVTWRRGVIGWFLASFAMSQSAGDEEDERAPTFFISREMPGRSSPNYRYATFHYICSPNRRAFDIVREYEDFALYTVLRSERLRPFVIHQGRRGLRFASEQMDLARPGNDNFVGPANLIPLWPTRPGKSYVALLSQRLLCLAIEDGVALNSTSSNDPHAAVLGRVFDLLNPIDVGGASSIMPVADEAHSDDDDDDDYPPDSRRVNEGSSDSASLRVARAVLRRFSKLIAVGREMKQLTRRADLEYVMMHVPGLRVPIAAIVRCADHIIGGGCACEGGVQAAAPPGSVFIPRRLHMELDLYHTLEDMLPEGAAPLQMGRGRIMVDLNFPSFSACGNCRRVYGVRSVGRDCVECSPHIPHVRSRLDIVLSYSADPESPTAAQKPHKGVFRGHWYYPAAAFSRQQIDARRAAMMRMRADAQSTAEYRFNGPPRPQN